MSTVVVPRTLQLYVENHSHVSWRFDSQKRGWHLYEAGSFRFHATQYHLYHGWTLGCSIHAGGTQEWQLLKRELVGFGLPI